MYIFETFGLGSLGVALIVLAYYGFLTYARSFFDNPQATITADMFLTMLKGPGSVPVTMCGIALFAGLWFMALAVNFGFKMVLQLFNSLIG